VVQPRAYRVYGSAPSHVIHTARRMYIKRFTLRSAIRCCRSSGAQNSSLSGYDAVLVAKLEGGT
jgi:hypothetical protein